MSTPIAAGLMTPPIVDGPEPMKISSPVPEKAPPLIAN